MAKSDKRRDGRGKDKGRNGAKTPQPAPKAAATESRPSHRQQDAPPTAQVARLVTTADGTLTFGYIDQTETPLFRLNLNQDKLGWPILRFTWCLNPKTVALLKERAIRFPYMFVSVYEQVEREGETVFQDVARAAFPLERGVGSIEFHKEGKFLLVANILGDSGWGKRSVAEAYVFDWLKKRNGHYENSLTYGGTYNRPNPALPYTFTCEVGVEPEFFAKKPKGWLWNWANLWFENPPDNECIFRRRKIIAFTIQPPVMLAFFLIFFLCMFILRQIVGVLLLAFLFLIGRRDLHLKPLWHPLDTNLVQCQDGGSHADWNNMGKSSSYFSLRGKKDRKDRYLTVALFLTPMTWIVVFGFFLMFSSHFGGQLIRFEPFGFAQVALCFTGLLVAFRVLGAILSAWISNIDPEELRRNVENREEMARLAEADRKRRAAEAEKKRIAEEREAFYKSQVAPLTCEFGGPQGAHVKDLPRSHRKVMLLAEEFKETSGICRPYQR